MTHKLRDWGEITCHALCALPNSEVRPRGQMTLFHQGHLSRQLHAALFENIEIHAGGMAAHIHVKRIIAAQLVGVLKNRLYALAG